MKMLITGANGQLGRELTAQGQSKTCAIQAPPEDDLDITDQASIERIMTHCRPDVVINTAAYTQVDKAETEATLAFEVNKDGCTNLARICAARKIPLIHISTDYVFNGQKDTPYQESDPVSPMGVYGRSKAEGEIEIRSILTEHLILRTSWLYGRHGQNFVKTMLRLATSRDEIQVVSDQYGSPTNAADLANAILIMADCIKPGGHFGWGTYHYCGQGVTSWFSFAEKIMALAQRYGGMQIPKVVPVSTAEYPTAAMRPAYSALDCNRIYKHFGISSQPWAKSLEVTIRQLLDARQEL